MFFFSIVFYFDNFLKLIFFLVSSFIFKFNMLRAWNINLSLEDFLRFVWVFFFFFKTYVFLVLFFSIYLIEN
jgi:hypothetical protein